MSVMFTLPTNELEDLQKNTQSIESNSKIQKLLEFKTYFSVCVDLKRSLYTNVTTNVLTTSSRVCSSGNIFFAYKIM